MTHASRVAAGIASVAVLAAAGCSAGSGAADPARPAFSLMPGTASAPPAPVAAIPGTNDNAYQAGPFKVQMKELVTLPAKIDYEDKHPKCVPVDVTNTSNTFTGWVAPAVEFVAGHSLKGKLLDTEAADPTGGDSGGSSDTLAPGQSQVLYACPQVAKGQYATIQLTKVSYGTPDEGTLDGTTVRLKF